MGNGDDSPTIHGLALPVTPCYHPEHNLAALLERVHMLKTVEGTLDPEGTIHFHEQLRLTRRQRVLVTLLEEGDDVTVDDEPDSWERLLSLLASPEFRNRPMGSAEELEALVEQNRNGWDE